MLKKTGLIALISFCLAIMTNTAVARDTKHMLSIEEAMNSELFKDRLDPSIKLYFGKSAGSVDKNYGTFVTNKKTNAFMKSDQEACRWVFLSALLSLQERARNEGGNAVVDIASFYKRNKVVSTTEYECHAGAIMAGVALEGKVVKFK